MKTYIKENDETNNCMYEIRIGHTEEGYVGKIELTYKVIYKILCKIISNTLHNILHFNKRKLYIWAINDNENNYIIYIDKYTDKLND